VLVGTRGEVPILHRGMKKPLLDAVAPGQMVVGYEIHQKLGLKAGDQATFRGRDFTISKLHPERGSVDDVTVWIDLGAAQEILGLENLIHGILALECECAGDRISQVRSEIQGILPGTKVVERYSQAVARAEARTQAKTTALAALAQQEQAGKETLEREAASRRELEDQHEALAAVLAPVVILAAAIWVGLLALSNVRQRREEIGVLRAIGVTSRSVLSVILGRAALLGLAGALLGVGLGLAAMPVTADLSPLAIRELLPIDNVSWTLILSFVVAPLLAAAASWLPALAAARQDPAFVLQGE
jgi:ABC-type lipoprotein release transport system permease subunit